MTPQKSIALNLTKQETECLVEIIKFWREDYHVKYKEIKPCYPFIDKLQAKITASLNKN